MIRNQMKLAKRYSGNNSKRGRERSKSQVVKERVFAELRAAESDVVRAAEERMLEAFLSGPALRAVESARGERV